jgi:arylsulfatase
LDVGEDSGAPVSPDYGPVGNHFNGEVKGVQLSIAEGENEGQVVDPKDAVRAMFGRQ